MSYRTLRIFRSGIQSQRLKKILYLHWHNIDALNPEKNYIMYVFPEKNIVPIKEV